MRKVFFVLIVSMLWALPVEAKTGDWATSDHARARLLSGVESIGDALNFEAALELDLAPEWHSYYKNPGDTGLPPRFKWDGSENVESVEVFWPTPKRKNEQGLFTVFSYSGKQTFPMIVNLTEPNKDTILNLTVDYMVCKDICIPDQLKLNLEINSGDGAQSSEQRLIEFAKRKVPNKDGLPNLKIETIVAAQDALTIAAYSKIGFENADVIAHTDDLAFTSPPKIVTSEEEEGKAMITMSVPEDIENLAEFLHGKKLEVVLTNSKDAVIQEIEF